MLGCLRTNKPSYVLISSMSESSISSERWSSTSSRLANRKLIGEYLIWLQENDPNETDMSETRSVSPGLIWLRRWNQILQWYDWDVKLTIDTDITETSWAKVLDPNFHRYDRDRLSESLKNICSRFSVLHTWDCDTL